MFIAYQFLAFTEVVVPPRKNASTRRGHPARRKTVREFKRLGYNRWREEKGYGVRWRIESLFSAVKRTFGESVRATRHYMLTPLTNLWG